MARFMTLDASGVPSFFDDEWHPERPADAIDVTAEQVDHYVGRQPWCHWDAAKGDFVDDPIPAPRQIVPSSASKLGLMRALREKGDWDKVKAALANNEELQEDWDAAQRISRADRLTQSMIATMGYSAADVDALMAQAEALAT